MKRFGPAIILALAAGCGGGSNGNGDGTMAAPPETAPPAWTLLSGGGFHSYGNGMSTALVTRDAVAWNFLHRWITGAAPETPVNFPSECTVSVLSNKKPTGGYSVAITGVTWSGTMATVHVEETGPAPGQMVTMMITSPYSLASLTAPAGFVLVQTDGGPLMMGLERTYEVLVNEHFGNIQDPQSNAANVAHTADLESGFCPLDGTALSGADLFNVSLAGTNSAHYCVEEGKYWMRQVVTGSQAKWFGPFSPGY